MYILYVDESGDVNSPESEHVVLGGCAIHESDIRALVRSIESVFAAHLDPHLRLLELHVQHIRKGKGGWRSVPAPVKNALLADVAKAIVNFQATSTHHFALFAVVRSPGAVPGADPLERIYEELSLRFNTFVRFLTPGTKNREFGMVVGDEAKYEAIVQPLVHDWQTGAGTRFGRLTRVAEVPLFLDSKLSRLIQVADLVAHAVFIHYERGDSSLFDMIEPAFHRDKLVVHGLCHLNLNHESCDCVACASRRQSPLPFD